MHALVSAAGAGASTSIAPAGSHERRSACAEYGAAYSFIEHGPVSVVTSYRKNYAASSMTETIHRYLPPEIGELLVYYVWLAVPFADPLQVLTRHQGLGAVGSFLWPANVTDEALTKSKPRNKTQMWTQTEDSDRGIEQREMLGGEEPWKDIALGAVIKEEFKRGLQTTASAPPWQHASVAIP